VLGVFACETGGALRREGSENTRREATHRHPIGHTRSTGGPFAKQAERPWFSAP